MEFCFFGGAGMSWPGTSLFSSAALSSSHLQWSPGHPKPQCYDLLDVLHESASLGNSESSYIRFLLSNPLILLF
jgi:hypothetical protein